MKRIVVVRHAKSSWADSTVPDHDRPLNLRGRWAAPRVAGALAERGCVPELTYCSTAARTRQTWELMAARFERGFREDDAAGARQDHATAAGAPQVRFLRELYLATTEALLELAASAPSDVDTLMILGHNPGIHSLACGLARRGDPEETELIRLKMPTGAAAVVELGGDRWDLVSGGGELTHLILPRRLETRTAEGRP